MTKKFTNTSLDLLTKIVFLLIIIYIVLSIVFVANFFIPRTTYKSQLINLTGIYTRQYAIGPCPTKERSYEIPKTAYALALADMLLTPKPYALVNLYEKLPVNITLSALEGKEIIIEGETTPDTWAFCINGKEQNVPLIKVINVQLTE